MFQDFGQRSLSCEASIVYVGGGALGARQTRLTLLRRSWLHSFNLNGGKPGTPLLALHYWRSDFISDVISDVIRNSDVISDRISDSIINSDVISDGIINSDVISDGISNSNGISDGINNSDSISDGIFYRALGGWSVVCSSTKLKNLLPHMLILRLLLIWVDGHLQLPGEVSHLMIIHIFHLIT